jgi:hypothetical protein
MSGEDRANKRDVETAHASTKPAVVGAHDTTASDADAFVSSPSTPGPSRASLPPILATRYELTRVIGVGGMGLISGRRVAGACGA